MIFVLLLVVTKRSSLLPYTTLFRSRRLVKVILKQSPLFMRKAMGRGRLSARKRTLPATIPFAESIATTSCLSRSEEHTSELQSPCNIVCRLLLEIIKLISNYHYEDR